MNARELAPAAAPAHAVTVYAGRRDWWHVPTSPLRHTGPARVALGIDAADVTGIGVWAMPDLTDLPPRAQLEALDALGGSALLCALKVDTSIRGWREHHAIELLDELLGDALWVAAVERPFGTKTRWVDGRRMRVGSEPTAAQRYWLGAVDALARARHVAARAAKDPARPAGRYYSPTVLRPVGNEWRAPIGVRAVAGDYKAGAVRWLLLHGRHVPEHNAAEGACIAAYAARACTSPRVPQQRSAPVDVRFVI